jgi:hypothetical protein
MPLAIELAAARARIMTPAELLGRIDDRFRILRARTAGSDERHATLRATVEWSYQLLDTSAQSIFARMAVFAAPVDLQAVTAVVADNEFTELDVLDGLTTLVDHSLVVPERDDQITRYRLLETMRVFARDVLTGRSDLKRFATAQAEWAAERVAVLLGQITGADEAAFMIASDELELFWPDLRAAVDYALSGNNAHLVATLVGHFGIESLLREREEVRHWAEGALALPDVLDHPLVGNLLGVAAALDWRAGNFDSMIHRIQQGKELRANRHRFADATLRYSELISLIVGGDLAAAQRLTEDALHQLSSAPKNSFDVALWGNGAAMNHCYMGEPQRAIAALDAMGDIANPLMRCEAKWVRAMALLELEPASAVPVARETVELARAIRATWMVDTVSNYLTAALALAGDAVDAFATMRSVLAHTAAGGGVQSLGNTVRNGMILFDRLGLNEPPAILAGWLDFQRIAIPGTAGMRAHAAKAAEHVAGELGRDRFAAAQDRGAAMTASQIVALLSSILDQAERELLSAP